jgi:peptide/nickel transport system substrate-binding protein
VLGANCHGVVNPLLDVQAYLPSSIYSANYGYYQDPQEVDLYNKMLRETDFPKQRALMRQFEKYVVDTQAHEIWVVWWYRIIPYQSYVKGWKISPSHYLDQDLATIWLDK